MGHLGLTPQFVNAIGGYKVQGRGDAGDRLVEDAKALQDAGIPLRRVINETNHRPWKKTFDAEGLWDRALADPQHYVDYVVAIAGDPVSVQVNKQNLTSMVVVHTVGQPAATVYWTHRAVSNQPR